jgi:glycosyltransferase involved in cell wall biosynthesis
MRIVIDMQGAQALGSRNRGIGRYTLAFVKGLVRAGGDHEFVIALNGAFPESIDEIREEFSDLLPARNIAVWVAPGPTKADDPANAGRLKAAQFLYETFLESLDPSIVLVTSLFEGLLDDAVTSIGLTARSAPVATILYDLIPLIYRNTYLYNPVVEHWYESKIGYLRRSDLLLAISDASARDAMFWLNFTEEAVVSVAGAVDEQFCRQDIDRGGEAALRRGYNLSKPFVMYTGGIDYRKNIPSLIQAFAALPKTIRDERQLAIVCSISDTARAEMEQVVRQARLRPGDVIFTGFVPEADLIQLYNICELFVFPSWYEGFGLPVLEAMKCGAPVIGANTSSIPEVIGLERALFDPHSVQAIADKMAEALTDAAFRAELIENAARRHDLFSWDATARKALVAMEKLVAQQAHRPISSIRSDKRPRLAYVSPLPPERSGIADYSSDLLRELSRHYEIDVIVQQPKISDAWVLANTPARTADWFGKNADRYDRVLYHFGNSEFHQHMFDLLRAVPGIVVLHDFFLSGVQVHREVHGGVPGNWNRELYRSHGYEAVAYRQRAADPEEVIWRYPCNFDVLSGALDVIVHSEFSRTLAQKYYGGGIADDWTKIPLLRVIGPKDRAAALERLSLAADDFVVCSFGILAATKLNDRLLKAWTKSKMAADPRCRLVFVGRCASAELEASLRDMIARSGCKERISITGWADPDLFRSYLAVADIAVQLRTKSRGETSAAVLDCMAAGIATIANANGSMAELDERAARLLPDEFDDAELTAALDELYANRELRQTMARNARDYVATLHNPRTCADQYRQAIEDGYARAGRGLQGLIQAMGSIDELGHDEPLLASVANSVATSLPGPRPGQRIFVDISGLVRQDSTSDAQRITKSVLSELLQRPFAGIRIDPIYAVAGTVGYRYARRFAFDLLECPSGIIEDERVDFAQGDVFFGLDCVPNLVAEQEAYLAGLRRRGMSVYFMIYDLHRAIHPELSVEETKVQFERWLATAAQGDGAICLSEAAAHETTEWFQQHAPERASKLKVSYVNLGTGAEISQQLLDLLQSWADFSTRSFE